jgi:hypothetical protein
MSLSVISDNISARTWGVRVVGVFRGSPIEFETGWKHCSLGFAPSRLRLLRRGKLRFFPPSWDFGATSAAKLNFV